jgi:hypothetical protein
LTTLSLAKLVFSAAPSGECLTVACLALAWVTFRLSSGSLFDDRVFAQTQPVGHFSSAKRVTFHLTFIKLAIAGVHHRIDALENTLLDAIAGHSEEIEGLKDRVTKGERLQKTTS